MDEVGLVEVAALGAEGGTFGTRFMLWEPEEALMELGSCWELGPWPVDVAA